MLGPLLFLIHIAGINEGLLSCHITRILKNVKTTDDCESLQVDLEQIFEWAQNNNMTFNNNKYKLMRYTPDGNSVDSE